MSEHVFRRATEADLPAIAAINAQVFLGDRDKPESARQWMECLWRAYPLYQYFVVEVGAEVVGYSGWQMHGGFRRAEPVIELDQLGINPSQQGTGLAPKLTEFAMRELIVWMRSHNDRIESHIAFIVWAYALNFNAISVYAKSFTDGVCGMRVQFGQRAENMLRVRVPIIMPVRHDTPPT